MNTIPVCMRSFKFWIIENCLLRFWNSNWPLICIIFSRHTYSSFDDSFKDLHTDPSNITYKNYWIWSDLRFSFEFQNLRRIYTIKCDVMIIRLMINLKNWWLSEVVKELTSLSSKYIIIVICNHLYIMMN